MVWVKNEIIFKFSFFTTIKTSLVHLVKDSYRFKWVLLSIWQIYLIGISVVDPAQTSKVKII
jgi:hypothetical protein